MNFNSGYGYNYMQPQRNEYAFVDGVEAARAYQCIPNSMMLLMDSQQPICYKKQVDPYGRTVAFEIYDLVLRQEKPPTEYVTKVDFEAFKASILKEGNNESI